MTGNTTLAIAVFGLVSSGIALAAFFIGSRRHRLSSRLADCARPEGQAAQVAAAAAKPGLGRSAVQSLQQVLKPQNESKIAQMKQRLLQAGLYRRHATAIYLSIKLVLMVAPMLVGLALASTGMISLTRAIIFGSAAGLVGTIAPTLWLGSLRSGRQKSVRRALPDALDVIVVCLEGGLSLEAAFSRVASELRAAHPLLAMEMAILRKEMELGCSTGDALRQFANRFDVEELRSMATVVTQAERFGASMVKAFRVHADSLRLKRHQHAETQAQKAPLKLIFPTVLCIFPALYIVLMGPAAVHLLQMFGNMSD